MQKIDKSEKNVLSKEYKAWLDELNMKNARHPEYSNKGKYYRDIFFNLLYCQKGVCAYTEQRLCSPDLILENLWVNDRYSGDSLSPGHLDHFDPKLKEEKGWEWDNFFVADEYINEKIKKGKNVHPILKPDSPGYDPYTLLDYDAESHFFIANTDIEDNEKKEQVKEMINTLGINDPSIKYKRQCEWERVKNDIEQGKNDLKIDRFFSAIEMLMKITKKDIQGEAK